MFAEHSFKLIHEFFIEDTIINLFNLLDLSWDISNTSYYSISYKRSWGTKSKNRWSENWL